MAPGVQFTKTWRLKNVGACVWTTSYRIALFRGEQMGAPSSLHLPLGVGLDESLRPAVKPPAGSVLTGCSAKTIAEPGTI